MSTDSVRPETLAGDPFAARGALQPSRPSPHELLEAIFEDERLLRRPHRPSERLAFCRAYLGPEHVEEVKLLEKIGLLEDGE